MTGGRRTFGPVVTLGVAAAVLAAVAAARPWVRLAEPGDSSLVTPVAAEDGEMALAAAVSLVLLASWGVVLVTRGLVRRLVAGLGLLAALGLAATVVVGVLRLPDTFADSMVEAGVQSPSAQLTGWFWVAAITTATSVVATALAVAWCPAWPEMGTRYDAPGTGRDESAPEDRTSLDLWKSMDEGRDPTA